jgi:GNAT superfamily N-acetyltransferase
MDIPFSDLEFVLLRRDHDLSSFRCQEAELSDFLMEDALSDQENRISVTRLAFFENRLVGYFTLVNDCLEVKALDESDGEPGYPYAKYPAIKIARLAVHDDYRGRNIGTNLLLKVLAITIRLSEYVGCRMITVDSKPDSIGFYRKFGFNPAHRKAQETVPLYIDYHRTLRELVSADSDLSRFMQE